jgi:hypothetical protein
MAYLRPFPGGVSRAAKGADCKSAASWLRRFESYLPHQPSLASRATARQAERRFLRNERRLPRRSPTGEGGRATGEHDMNYVYILRSRDDPERHYVGGRPAICASALKDTMPMMFRIPRNTRPGPSRPISLSLTKSRHARSRDISNLPRAGRLRRSDFDRNASAEAGQAIENELRCDRGGRAICIARFATDRLRTDGGRTWRTSTSASSSSPS